MPKIIISAGDAITSKLVEQAGFDGIWISGFEVSARLGLPDNGSLTLTEMLNVAKPIVQSVKIPVFVDVDTGYGNFNRTVEEFEAIGVYAICVEDNVPTLKQNSLWGSKIPLMDMMEFSNKINVRRKNLKIIARTEALIRGYGFKEARKRLDCYAKAGADILMPHARKIDDIMTALGDGREYAIVPTKFPGFTNEQLGNMGYSYVIWANQTERVKIKAVRDCLSSLKHEDCAAFIESNLSATLDEMKGLTREV